MVLIESSNGFLEGQGEDPGGGVSCPDPDDYRGDADFLKVLQCDVVMGHLMQYLSVKDMKALRRTSKEALFAVQRTTAFSDRVRFCIDETEKKVHPGVLQNCFHPWKCLSITVPISDKLFKALLSTQRLECVQSLKLFFTPRRAPAATVNGKKCALEILRRLGSLRELELEHILFEHLLKDKTCKGNVKQLLENLECLDLHYYCLDQVQYRTPFPRVRFNLRKIVIREFPTESFNKIVLKMVAQSKETLEELQLRCAKWEGRGWHLILCPKLKKVDLSRIEVKDMEEVEMFLGSQPPLQELTVETDSPSRLLTSIQGRSSKLRKLRLKIMAGERVNQSEGEPVLPPPALIDWSVVESMEVLEDLDVHLFWKCSKSAFMDVVEILRWLPSERLRRISIQRDSDGNFCFSQSIGGHLSRFGNLEVLRLYGLKFFNDACLQEIIMGCSKLRHLQLEELKKVTDFGISGVKKSSSSGNEGEEGSEAVKVGVSLNELKDLGALKIRKCPNISLAGLLKVGGFHSLHSFEFRPSSSNEQAQTSPSELALQILAQNPRLTEFVIGTNQSMSSGDDALFKDEARKLFPNVRRLEIEQEYDSRRVQNQSFGDMYKILIGSFVACLSVILWAIFFGPGEESKRNDPFTSRRRRIY